MSEVPLARHLLRAKDLADVRYFEPLTVAELAAAAGLSPAHFSREFKRTFGEAPHQYDETARASRGPAATHRLVCRRYLLRRWSSKCWIVHDELPADVRPDSPTVPVDVPAGGVSGTDPALRGSGLRPPEKPHVSRRRGGAGLLGSCAST
jgi:Bacterial regulatory helix-turn-helix proteins, AraC family